MTDDTVQRDLGRMEAQIAALALQVAELSRQTAIINKTLSEARGGWRTLIWIAGASGATGAAITWLATFFHLKIPGG